MKRFIKLFFVICIITCISSLGLVLAGYYYVKPDLPEISLVDQSQLQIPLKIYTEDGELIGEFGEIRRRPIKFDEIPKDIKNAFLAAEDADFYRHYGVSYKALLRASAQYIRAGEIVSGGGTLTMQVVRGYLLTREQKLIRKIKEIYLALQLEGQLSKEEIFELYVNRIFLGNRSYGIEAASYTYFDKTLDELSLSESATIAAITQLPSTVNPIKSPNKTKQRRNWILNRMLILGHISEEEFKKAIGENIVVASNINLYNLDAGHLAERTRQEIIKRYGISVYNQGWSVYTTINSKNQTSAVRSVREGLSKYDKRHGWRDPKNYISLFNESHIEKLLNYDTSFILDSLYSENIFVNEENLIGNKISKAFEENAYYPSHKRALVIDVKKDSILYLTADLDLNKIEWTNDYSWCKEILQNNLLGPEPESFLDFLEAGDLVYLFKDNENYIIDQIPIAESALISVNPLTEEVKAYVGGYDFRTSNFDRVSLSYPQSGSSFKPFIYASALANGYNLSTKVNDAPLIFQDKNLEDVWKPKNYTGKFYGPISLREALIQSVNIVSIKLLREIGINDSHNYLKSFGFAEERLPKDLSLALGSGNFSPAEMVRAFSVIPNQGKLSNFYFIKSIMDRDGNEIFNSNNFNTQNNIEAFPWLVTLESNLNKPYYLNNYISSDENNIDPRITFLLDSVLKEFMQRGAAGRLTADLNRTDFGGKTGTTNEAISTWFSGYHNELVTSVWVGKDNFQSLGENEFGSTVALPIWIEYMKPLLKNLDNKEVNIPENISFVRVNKDNGLPAKEEDIKTYFELFLQENIID